MQQTILALGALMIIMTTAINFQRSIIMIQEVTYVREMESAALDISKFRIETIFNDTGFDENWNSETVLPSSTGVMTPSSNFGPDAGEATMADFDDVDDFHGFTELNVLHAIGQDTFRFNIDYFVSYIDPISGDTTSASTYAKQLTASVVSADSIGARVARAIFSQTTIVSEDV